MKDLQVPCIVCGEYITWDDSPLPAACATHTYQEVFEAYDQAAQQSAQANKCPECGAADGYHKTGCNLWLWEPSPRRKA